MSERIETVRRALLRVAEEAYEDAGLRGLCAEGRWEAALDALRTAPLPPEPPAEDERPG